MEKIFLVQIQNPNSQPVQYFVNSAEEVNQVLNSISDDTVVIIKTVSHGPTAN